MEQVSESASEERLPDGRPAAHPDAPLDQRIILVVCAILLVLTALFVAGLAVQWQSYHAGITAALAEPVTNHAAVLSYARALDAAIVKTSALFLGYLLVFTGALYVLRTVSVAYSLGVKGTGYAGTLQTTSPGLVIITLGVLLIAITILRRSDVNYVAPTTSQQIGVTPDSQTVVESGPDLSTTTPPSERK